MPNVGTVTGWSDSQVEQIRKLWADGVTAARIAEELGGGITKNAVVGKLHRLGLKRVEPAAEDGESSKPAETPGADIEVPRWVRPEHRADYRSIAADRGEEEAARWARAAKNGDADQKAWVPPARKASPAQSPAVRAKPVPRKSAASRSPASNAKPAPLQAKTPVPGAVKRPVSTPAARPPAEPPPTDGVHIADLKEHHCRWPKFGEREHTRYCGERRPDPKRPYCAEHLAQATTTARETREERATKDELTR